MKKNPLVSVIVPVYNVEKYLPQCLDSLVRQTYDRLEIICVDDGSPDDSIKILRDFARGDKRVKIIRQKNAGLSAARNAGLAAASGEYVHFMDSDDYVFLDFYEKMVAAAANADADMTTGGIITSNETVMVSFDHAMALSGIYEKARWTKCLKYGHVTRYLFRRMFLVRNKFRFEDGRFVEDLVFILPAIKAANVVATAPGAVYYYIKQRAGSILTMRKWGHRRKLRRDLAWAYAFRDRFMAENNLPRDLLKGEHTVSKIKLFGIPVGKIVRYKNRNVAVLYLFGINVLRFKTERK